MMSVKTADATINTFLSVEYTAMTSTSVPSFNTWAAIYHDEVDYYDG